MDGENHSMTDWKTILAGADDEYLAGLSNKGTVKRAHKDRETTPCEILDTGDQGINVKAWRGRASDRSGAGGEPVQLSVQIHMQAYCAGYFGS